MREKSFLLYSGKRQRRKLKAGLFMDNNTRSIIENVVYNLINQGLKNFDYELKNISTISDDILLNFILTYYD